MEMKKGERTSRFGRPQKEVQQDANTVPTEVAKFIPKHSPKRLKPKEFTSEPIVAQNGDNSKVNKCHDQENVKLEEENIPTHNKENLSENQKPKIPDTVSSSSECDSKEELVEANNNNHEENITIVKSGTEVFEVIMLSGNAEATEAHSDGVSDTDSALGSAASCADTKDEEFTPGQILWGSFNRANWYPCIVCPDENGVSVMGEFEGQTTLLSN